jgi:hypothetical protein
MASILTPNDRHQLKKMIEAHNVEDNTDKIRENKHTAEIQRCIRHITDLKENHPEYDKQQLEEEALKEAGFLFFHYFDIYNLVIKQTNLTVLHKLLDILNQIEAGLCDQHEGSFLVGKYLKELYIDDIVRRSESEATKTPVAPAKDITWNQFKTMNR